MRSRNSHGLATIRDQRVADISQKQSESNNDKNSSDAISGDRQSPVFEDPRVRKDRRIAHFPELVPEVGCRRKNERRSDRINLGVWWMKRRYGNDHSSR